MATIGKKEQDIAGCLLHCLQRTLPYILPCVYALSETSEMTETNLSGPYPGKQGISDRGTETQLPSDFKRFKQGGQQSPHSDSGAAAPTPVSAAGSVKTNVSQHVTEGVLSQSSTASAAAAASLLKAQRTKPPKEKKDGCCYKSSRSSSQNLKEQSTSSSAETKSQTPRSPKSSIFTRLLHRQSHGASDGEGHKNAKSFKTDGHDKQGKSTPKSPKSRLSDGRLKLFNRSSSLKEVKIALPSGKSPVAKSASHYGAARSSSLRQPAIREKSSIKNKDDPRSKTVSASTQPLNLSSSEYCPTDIQQTDVGGLDTLGKKAATTDVDLEDQGVVAGSSPVHYGHVEDMDTSTTKDEVPKCRRESVQAWVNSISEERLDGVEDMDHHDAAAGGTDVVVEMTQNDVVGAGHGVRAEDDELTLGAEAKLLTPPKDVVLSRATKHRLAEVGAASGRSRQTSWREMFSSIRTESFNSEGSAHSVRTWDSIEQLLHERTGDPVEILTNLGFHSQESDDSLPSRIPERFLRQESVASGISVEKFINSNPDLKEYVALTRSISEPSTATLASAEPVKKKPVRRPSPTSMSFASVVRTLTFIRRTAARMSWKDIDMTRKMLMPVDSATARLQSKCYSSLAPSGKSFKSILHPDNSQHLAEQGVYDDANSRRGSMLNNAERDERKSQGDINMTLHAGSPRPSLTNIPGRFTSTSMLIPDAKDSPVPSPQSAHNTPRGSFDRIPARFSPRNSSVTPPPIAVREPERKELQEPKGGDIPEKKNSLNIPGDAPRSRSASLWKRLSDAGREMEQQKRQEAEAAQAKNCIDTSKPGNCPDVPLRFFLHSQESILNAPFNLSTESQHEDVRKDMNKLEDEGNREKETVKTPDAVCIHDVTESDKRRPSVQVLLRTATEDEETTVKQNIDKSIKRPENLQKRRSDETIEEKSVTDANVPPKKPRRKLGSMCKAADQVKLLRSLEQDNAVEDMEVETAHVASETDNDVTNIENHTCHPKVSVTSAGLADDEDDDTIQLSRREKASKYLRKFLSQQEEDKAEESDSDGSIGDPAEPVEFGTAVMVKVIANKVRHMVRKSGRVAPEEPIESLEEVITTDQGSISGDDIENIYGESGEVDLDSVIQDSTSIDASLPIGFTNNVMELHQSKINRESDLNQSCVMYQKDSLGAISNKATANAGHIGSEICDVSLNSNALYENNAPRRRVTLCTALLDSEKLKDFTSQIRKESANDGPRYSDGCIDYHSLNTYIRRKRFSRQENVKPGDLAICDPQRTNEVQADDIQNDKLLNDEEVCNSPIGLAMEDNTTPDVEMFVGIVSSDTSNVREDQETEDKGLQLENGEHVSESPDKVSSVKGTCASDNIVSVETLPPGDKANDEEVITEQKVKLQEECPQIGHDWFSEVHHLPSVRPINSTSSDHQLVIDGSSQVLCDSVEPTDNVDKSQCRNESSSADLINWEIEEEMAVSKLDAKPPKAISDQHDFVPTELDDYNNNTESAVEDMVIDHCITEQKPDIVTTTQVSDIFNNIVTAEVMGYVEEYNNKVDSLGPVNSPCDNNSEGTEPSLHVDEHQLLPIVISTEENMYNVISATDEEKMSVEQDQSYNRIDNGENLACQSSVLDGDNCFEYNNDLNEQIASNLNTKPMDLSAVHPAIDIQSSDEVPQGNPSDHNINPGMEIAVDSGPQSQQKTPLIVSLGCDGATSPSGSDQGNSDCYDDMFGVLSGPRRVSFLRYTEIDRDDSIRSELEEGECIFQEHLIDDNVLDRSLSEHSYLADILEQLKRNHQNMARHRRSSSVGSVEHRLSTAAQPLELDQGLETPLIDTPLTESQRKTSLPYEPKRKVKEAVEVIERHQQTSESHQTIYDTKPVDSEQPVPIQSSFDLEEVSSADIFNNTLPVMNLEKQCTKGGSFVHRPYSRAFSAQSDSSGFVEMEGTEIDWQELKALGLGSTADSESSSRRSSHSTADLKKAHTKEHQRLKMGTTIGKPLDTNDPQKSDDTADEESLWNIVENGHKVTQKDFLFGVPQKLRGTEREVVQRRARRRVRRQRPPTTWTSRLYIDPPTSPKVTPASKMEVKFTIEKGQIKDIENAQVVPVATPVFTTSLPTRKAVSYLHLCVTRADGEFEIKPVDKGNFTSFSQDGAKFDVSQHQVICSLLRRSSTAWKPDSETDRLCTLWSAANAAERREHHSHLLEEIKLIQHAITKFKVEFRVLELRTNSIYTQNPESLSHQQQQELVELGNLRSQIMHEIHQLEQSLSERMRSILSEQGGLYTPDLTSINTVHQVVEVLKEQVYHSSVIHGMDLPCNQPATKTQDDQVVAGSELIKQLSQLQDHMDEHQTKTASQLSSTMEQMREVLLAEVRESVQKETEDLRGQVLGAEMEVLRLQEKLKLYTEASGSATNPATKKPELRFPISRSPVGEVSMDIVPAKSAVGQNGTEIDTEEHIEVQVSRSQPVEESPIEQIFGPISKQDGHEVSPK